MWDALKVTIITVLSSVCAYLEPIDHVITVLFLLAGTDILFGIIGGIIANGERFKFKKFILAAWYVFLYLGIATMIYTIGKLQGDFDAAMMVVKTVTYVFIYFYSANILKNLRSIFPDNKVIVFLDYIIGFEFTKRIPQLEKFLEQHGNENKG